jgi:hypothetical protein
MVRPFNSSRLTSCSSSYENKRPNFSAYTLPAHPRFPSPFFLPLCFPFPPFLLPLPS